MKKRFFIPGIIFAIVSIVAVILGTYLVVQAHNIPPAEDVGGALALPFVVIIEIYFSVWCYLIGLASMIVSIPLIIISCKKKKKQVE